MRLVLVGPPGSGKGTQAKRLAGRLGLTYVGTGDMLRDAVRRGTPVGLRVMPLLERGLLVPDDVVNEAVADLFRGPLRTEKFVADGYPRTPAQAVSFDALLAREVLGLDAVVSLAIADDEVVRRIGGRRCCPKPGCNVCYHVEAAPPRVPGVCDRCGSPLVVRDDDREETIRRRLVEFHKNTDALVAHYRAKGLLREVPATDPVEAVYENILKAVGPPG
jgi:adenylate kinase